eukprot:4170817-Amphidinium_carterae.1
MSLGCRCICRVAWESEPDALKDVWRCFGATLGVGVNPNDFKRQVEHNAFGVRWHGHGRELDSEGFERTRALASDCIFECHRTTILAASQHPSVPHTIAQDESSAVRAVRRDTPPQEDV